MKPYFNKHSPILGAIIFILLILIGTAEVKAGGYFELGAGYTGSLLSMTEETEWDNADALGAYISTGYKFESGNRLTWVHISQWNAGPPFNNKAESSVDFIGYVWCWGDC